MSEPIKPFSDEALEKYIADYASSAHSKIAGIHSLINRSDKITKPFEVGAIAALSVVVLRSLSYGSWEDDLVSSTSLLTSMLLFSAGTIPFVYALHKSQKMGEEGICSLQAAELGWNLLEAKQKCRFSLRAYLYEKRYGTLQKRKRKPITFGRHFVNINN